MADTPAVKYSLNPRYCTLVTLAERLPATSQVTPPTTSSRPTVGQLYPRPFK